MILENGVVRTLDPQLPTARALAIAGELVAGGVGVHETALASPEVVDLGGRTVLPGLTATGTWAATAASAEELRQPARELAAVGVTCVVDTSGALAPWQELRERTLLPVRVRLLVAGELAETLAASGIRSGFGDDVIRVVYRVEAPEPLDPREVWRSGEAAVRAATVEAARRLGEGRRRGRLLPGCLADLVVLDRDPLSAGGAGARVVATMAGGRWTHDPPPWD